MATKEKGVQVSATVTRALDQKLEDHRWSVRKTKTELVRLAVIEYAIKHGLVDANDTETTGLPSPTDEGHQEHPESA